MGRQLTILDTPPAWRIDAATREAGRRGIAEARASLRTAMAAQHTAEATETSPEHPSHGRSAA